MSLTKCPNCGHTVLSVASQCPACLGPLTSTFLGLEHEGELAECRSCGRPVRSRTAVCPHCGIPKPARRGVSPRLVLPILAAALLSVMAVALRDRGFQTARADSTAARADSPVARVDSAAPQPVASPAVVAQAVVAAPPRLQAQSAASDTPAARPARAADSATPSPSPATDANASLPEVAAAMDSGGLLARGLQRRWTTDWSNLRAAPHNEAYVVRVLRPGTEVHGVPQRFGWWAVVWRGDTVGYLAGALLQSTRPGR